MSAEDVDPTADFFDEDDEKMQALLANARLSQEQAGPASSEAVAPVRQQHEEPLEMLDVEEVTGEVDVNGGDRATDPLPGDGVTAEEEEGDEGDEEDWEAAALLTVSVRCPEAAGLNDIAKFFKKAGNVANAYRVSGKEVRVQFCSAEGVEAAKALDGAELCGDIVRVEQ